MGRPKEMDTRKLVSMSQELAERITEFRFRHRYASEALAMREALDEGMKAIDQRAAASAKVPKK